MFQRDPITFNRLKALSMRKRMDVVSAPEMGPALFSALTPTDLALLFPDYFKRILPNVDGFRRAISARSAEQNAVSAQALEQRLASVEDTTASISRPWADRQRQGGGTAAAPPPSLNAAEARAWQKLQEGKLNLNSEEGKIFARLGDAKLAALGITKGKDSTGVDIYQYSAPSVSNEEVIGRLKTGGTSADKMALELIKKREGFLSVAKWDVNHLRLGYGTDTITLADGTVKEVKAGDHVSREDAERDLLRRMPEFQHNGIIKYVGQDAWNKLSPASKAALTSLAYNYGSIQNLSSLREAIRSGDKNAIADAVASYANHKPYNVNGRPVNYDRRMEEANMIRNSSDTSDGLKPEGPNGQYSEKQIEDMRQKMVSEKNDQRRQEFANAIYSYETQNNIPHSADVTAAMQGGDLSALPAHSQHIGESYGSGQCVALSQHFAPGVGGAGNWKFKSGTDGIVPGAVIATTNYGNGQIGRMAKSFSDHKSRFHTGVVLTAPDASGNVLIYDQWSGKGGGISKVNINNYNGTGITMAAVQGGEPTERSKQAIQLALANASPAEKAAIEATGRGEKPDVAAIPHNNKIEEGTGNAEPVKEQYQTRPGEAPEPPPVAPPEPSATVQKQTQLNEKAVQDIKISEQNAGVPSASPQPGAPATSGAPPAAAPAPMKITPNRYTVDRAGFINAIKETPEFKGNPLSFMASEQMIIDGFNDDPRVKAAGVHYDAAKGTITMKDPNNPQVKEVMTGMNTERFMKPIEPPKPVQKQEAPKEAPTSRQEVPNQQAAPRQDVNKPAQSQQAPAAKQAAPKQQTPQPSATVNAPPPPQRAGEATESPPPAPPAPKAVSGFSDGGSFAAPDTVNFYKVDKNDDTVAIDPKSQSPIATLKSGEGLSSGDSRVDVTPQPKDNSPRPEPSPLTNMVSQIQSLQSNVQTALEIANKPSSQMTHMSSDTPSNHQNMIDSANRMIVNQQKFSPSFDRAMGRIADPHFSYGNKRGDI